MDQITDEQLIEQFYGANQGALSMLFERYKGYLFNFAWRILGNRADAEDVVSECFTQVCLKKYNPLPQVKFKTWLFKVAHNKSLDYIRIRKRRGLLSLFKDDNQIPLDVPDPRALVREQMEQQDFERIIDQGIKSLPVEQREALLLREYQSMSYLEIAEVLGCSLENVKILIFRARQNLKLQLPPLLGEGR